MSINKFSQFESNRVRLRRRVNCGKPVNAVSAQHFCGAIQSFNVSSIESLGKKKPQCIQRTPPITFEQYLSNLHTLWPKFLASSLPWPLHHSYHDSHAFDGTPESNKTIMYLKDASHNIWTVSEWSTYPLAEIPGCLPPWPLHGFYRVSRIFDWTLGLNGTIMYFKDVAHNIWTVSEQSTRPLAEFPTLLLPLTMHRFYRVSRVFGATLESNSTKMDLRNIPHNIWTVSERSAYPLAEIPTFLPPLAIASFLPCFTRLRWNVRV